MRPEARQKLQEVVKSSNYDTTFERTARRNIIWFFSPPFTTRCGDMMKYRLAQTATAVLIAGLAVTASAQMKIAFVDVRQAIMNTEEAQQRLQEIEAEIAPERDRLQALQNEMTALEERFAKDSSVMSDSERRTLSNEYENKQGELNLGVQRMQREIQDKQRILSEEMTPKLNAVLEDLVALEGYDYIENKTVGLHLYVNSKHDITRKVTELINDKSTE